MSLNLVITGVGGQGNVLASQILGRSAVNKGLKVTIGETFGLSQRGGAVMSHVRISKNRVPGPIIPPNSADIIVGLEPLESLRVLKEYGSEQTALIVNSRPIYPLNVISGDMEYPDLEWIRSVLGATVRSLFWLRATSVALELGGPIMLNMIMLGALCGLPDFPINSEDVKQVLEEFFPQSKLEANYKALERGGGLISENEN